MYIDASYVYLFIMLLLIEYYDVMSEVGLASENTFTIFTSLVSYLYFI